MDTQIKIVDFYKDQDIFITGGLGFMGKVLIEKLLRSCPDLKRIFVLIRRKKDKSEMERLVEMLKSPLFDVLKKENNSVCSKLIPISGDTCLDGLGISEADFELLENVSIIFHSAATIRFREPFSQSILINTNGTYQVLQMAEKLRNLKVFVHVSTIFCNLDQGILEEKIYPAYADWRNMIDLAKKSKDDILQTFVERYTSFNHNNYTLSKHLAEQVANDYKDKIPIVVFRPSVVINAISEPIPGWTDTLSGPCALALGFGTGLIRMTYADITGYSELIAVDVAIKAMIVAAYKKGIEKRTHLNVDVYNLSEKYHPLHIISVGEKFINQNPFEKCIWNPSNSLTNCWLYFMINFLIFQLLPSIFFDSLLFLAGQKPFLVRMQKKIYNGIMAYRPFAAGNYNFKCKNIYHLDRLIHPEEFEKFAFMQFHRAAFNEYFITCLKGLKLYFLKDPAESSSGAIIRSKIFYFLDKFFKIIFYLILFRWIVKTDWIKNIL